MPHHTTPALVLFRNCYLYFINQRLNAHFLLLHLLVLLHLATTRMDSLKWFYEGTDPGTIITLTDPLLPRGNSSRDSGKTTSNCVGRKSLIQSTTHLLNPMPPLGFSVAIPSIPRSRHTYESTPKSHGQIPKSVPRLREPSRPLRNSHRGSYSHIRPSLTRAPFLLPS